MKKEFKKFVLSETKAGAIIGGLRKTYRIVGSWNPPGGKTYRDWQGDDAAAGELYCDKLDGSMLFE